MSRERIVVEDVTVDEVPAHVAPDRVVDFDYMRPPGIEHGDVYRALARLHDGPDVVWTPHHGGHWIATRAADIRAIQENWTDFSAAEKSVPRGRMPPMPPITVDPPDHTRYRAVLNPYFAEGRIERDYEPVARTVFSDLIERIRPRGACEFADDFASVAPIAVFLDFANLPQAHRTEFLSWGRCFSASPSPEARMRAHGSIVAYLDRLLEERVEHPGDDVFTGISRWRGNPRYRNRDELVGMAQLVFLGGQDTVAAQLAFAMWRLAERPALQRRLRDEPDRIPAAVDELLRRHALSSTGRLVMRDLRFGGATLKEGEMILVLGPLSGIDPRACEDPFTVDLDRGPVAHNSMGNGPHRCVGRHLARMEMRVFLEEWCRRMPEVRLDPDAPPPASHAGPVIGVDRLHLAWAA